MLMHFFIVLIFLSALFLFSRGLFLICCNMLHSWETEAWLDLAAYGLAEAALCVWAIKWINLKLKTDAS